jgi:hypothetical protein
MAWLCIGLGVLLFSAKNRGQSGFPSRANCRSRLLSDCEPDRHSSSPPIAALLLESPRDFVTATPASAVFQIPFAEFVPIALDQQITATRAPRAAALAIVHVTGVNVVQAF